MWIAQTIGSGQSWQDVTALRAIGTSYVNDSGRPIWVSVMQQSVDGAAAMYVSGTRVCNWGNSELPPSLRYYTVGTCTAIIPLGSDYYVTAWGGSVWYQWLELR